MNEVQKNFIINSSHVKFVMQDHTKEMRPNPPQNFKPN